MDKKFDVIMVWYQNDWGLYGRRNEMIAQTLAKHPLIRKVLHIEPPISLEGLSSNIDSAVLDRNISTNLKRLMGYNDNGVWLFTPNVPSSYDANRARKLVSSQLQQLFKAYDVKNFILWLYPPHPISELIFDLFCHQASLICCDVVDDHRHYFLNNTQGYTHTERVYKKLISGADICFTVSEHLKEEFSAIQSNIFHFPNAVDLSLYSKDYDVPDDIRLIPSPIIGYTGSLLNRIDCDLIDLLAKAEPDYSIVLIGTAPSAKVAELVRKHKNIYYLGPKKYTQIPGYIDRFNVCIIPHLVDKFTEAMNPLKLYNYLAAGKPVVTTSIAGVKEFSDVISVVETKGDFLEKVKYWVKQNKKKEVEKRKKKISDHTWEKRIEKMIGLITHTHCKRDASRMPEICGTVAICTRNLVSIIILTHNQLEYTKKCISSIFKHTKETFELIVVDNGSTDGTVGYLESEVRGRRSEVRIKIIKNSENLGFAVGNNQGMAAAEGDYVLLMNNDLVVTPGWLGRLIACAERKPQIGIVGPVSNYVSGPQLIKDVSYDTTSLARLNKFSNAFSKKHAGQSKPFWRVVGFCMLIKRAVIEKIGGLDGRYGLGNFEDDDFSLRATLAGFESCIASDCFVHHFGSRTFVGARIDYRESLNKNWEIYKKKWGIPADVAYGASYDMASVVKDGFIPAKHYCPLNSIEYSMADGEQLFGMSDIEGAKRIFEQILSAAPNSIEALNNLGVIAFQEGEIDQAISYFTRVLEIDPDYFEAMENLGKCMEAKKDHAEGVKWFKRALGLRPDDISLLNSLGNCFIQTEDFVTAREVYEKSLQLDSSQESIEMILREMGRLEEAKKVGT